MLSENFQCGVLFQSIPLLHCIYDSKFETWNKFSFRLQSINRLSQKTNNLQWKSHLRRLWLFSEDSRKRGATRWPAFERPDRRGTFPNEYFEFELNPNRGNRNPAYPESPAPEKPSGCCPIPNWIRAGTVLTAFRSNGPRVTSSLKSERFYFRWSKKNNANIKYKVTVCNFKNNNLICINNWHAQFLIDK